jgi:hypothetical protein
MFSIKFLTESGSEIGSGSPNPMQNPKSEN